MKTFYPHPLPWHIVRHGLGVPHIIDANGVPVPQTYDGLVAVVNTLGPSGAQRDILAKLDAIIGKVNDMSAEMDTLEAKVSAEETVIASATTLLTTLNGELKAALASNDTPRIAALSAKLDSDTTALAAAVAANTETPAAPAAPAA